MTGTKVLAVIGLYRERFEKERIPKIDIPHETGVLSDAEMLAHCHGMLDKMGEFVREERMEKAFRWLGFIQGCLWSAGWYTLEDLKNHNRPDDMPPK